MQANFWDLDRCARPPVDSLLDRSLREMLMEATYYYVHLVRFLPAAQAYLLLIDERSPPVPCAPPFSAGMSAEGVQSVS